MIPARPHIAFNASMTVAICFQGLNMAGVELVGPENACRGLAQTCRPIKATHPGQPKGAVTGFDTAAIAVGVLLILLNAKVNPAILVLGAAVVSLALSW